MSAQFFCGVDRTKHHALFTRWVTTKKSFLYISLSHVKSLNVQSDVSRSVTAGKPKKVTIIARVRKMVMILNSMHRDGVMWKKPRQNLMIDHILVC